MLITAKTTITKTGYNW